MCLFTFHRLFSRLTSFVNASGETLVKNNFRDPQPLNNRTLRTNAHSRAEGWVGVGLALGFFVLVLFSNFVYQRMEADPAHKTDEEAYQSEAKKNAPESETKHSPEANQQEPVSVTFLFYCPS